PGTPEGNSENPESNPGSKDNPKSNGNNESKGNNNGANKEYKLDNVPKTGDDGMSPIFYMTLALMSLIMLGFLLFGNRKKKHI
uniref:LPXTG cell wall anchor domain-containing protein n=1 Tax=Bacillus ndiopicus TaxID=1347368 RepID=UPI0005A8BAAE